MLVLADRGFFSFGLWVTYRLTGVHLPWRVTKTMMLPVLEPLPDRSYPVRSSSNLAPARRASTPCGCGPRCWPATCRCCSRP